jgi:group I intron endonuclease
MTDYGRIYIIRNTINTKVYVGQTTVSIKLRFQNHLSAARHGLDYVIGKAIRKYGEEHFYVELLEECLVTELNDREKYWIKFFNSTNYKCGYNMSIGGNATYVKKEVNKEQIISLFNSGMPAYKIAKLLHLGVPRVTDVLKNSNIKYGLALQKLSEDKNKTICKLYLEGYGTMDICRKFSVSKSTVRKLLISNNIRLRPKQETNKLRRKLLASKKMSHENPTSTDNR